MSAYSFYSRSVYSFLFFFFISFKEVRESMSDQARQCDIFKKIASQWKEMSPEEKKPYEEKVKSLTKIINNRQKMIINDIKKK